MARAKWDEIGEHFYETGTDRGMVYPFDNDTKTYKLGVPWNGLTGFTESPSGAEETKLYADNAKYLSLRSAEEFGATITAYTYPDEVAELDGSAFPVAGIRIYQQARKSFGFCVRTLLGNDTELNDHGYRLHLCYGLTISPSERGYTTVNDSPEAIEFSWEASSVPVDVAGYKKTALLTIDSDKVDAAKLAAFEDIIYGLDETEDTYFKTADTVMDPTKTYYEYNSSTQQYTETADTSFQAGTDYYEKTPGHAAADPRLPLPDEVIAFFSENVGG